MYNITIATGAIIRTHFVLLSVDREEMDITRLNVEELFGIVSKEAGERVATILKDNGVNGQGLLQLNEEEAKEVFPVLGDRLSVRAFIRRFNSSSQVQQVSYLDVNSSLVAYQLYCSCIARIYLFFFYYIRIL